MNQCVSLILFFKINNSSSNRIETFSQSSCLCWSGGWRGPALHAAVQSWNRLHSCTAPGLAQHVHYRGGCHDQRLGNERRTQVQLSSGKTAEKDLPYSWVRDNLVVSALSRAVGSQAEYL